MIIEEKRKTFVKDVHDSALKEMLFCRRELVLRICIQPLEAVRTITIFEPAALSISLYSPLVSIDRIWTASLASADDGFLKQVFPQDPYVEDINLEEFSCFFSAELTISKGIAVLCKSISVSD